MFRFFERRIDPFPETRPGVPPGWLRAFVWHYIRDAAPWLIAMSCFTALIAVGEVRADGRVWPKRVLSARGNEG